MRRLLFVLAALVLVGAGCASTGGPASPTAATVDGTTISMASFFDDLDAFATNEEVRAALQLTEPYGEEGDTSYSTAYTAQVMSLRVGNLLIEQELDRRGEAPSDSEREQAEQALTQVPSTGDLPQDVRDRLVEQVANQQALDRILTEEQGAAGGVTDEAVRQYYDDNLDAFMTNLGGDAACLSHILVAFDPTSLSGEPPTPEQEAQARARAEEALDRLDAGEDFATVAAVSDDTASAADGGDLGCIGPSSGYPPEFAEAAANQPLNEVGDIVRSDFGFHLLLVRSRGVVPFEEIEDQIRQQLEQQQQQQGGSLGPWLQRRAAEADVSVDARFGSFDPASGSLVVPPQGPTPPTSMPALDELDEQLGAGDAGPG